MAPSLDIVGFNFGGGSSLSLSFSFLPLLFLTSFYTASNFSVAIFKKLSTSFFGAIIVPGGVQGLINLKSGFLRSLVSCCVSVSALLIGGGGGSGITFFFFFTFLAASVDELGTSLGAPPFSSVLTPPNLSV